MVVDTNSEMTVAVTAGSNILLLAPATGPLVQPTQTPENEAELCCWVNDNSAAPATQFWSFARAGHYILVIERVDIAGAAFVQADTVCTALKNTTVTEVFTQQLGGTADHPTTWVFHIDVAVAAGSVTLTNANGVNDVGRFILTLGQ